MVLKSKFIAAWHEAMGWADNHQMVIRLTLRDTLGATATHDIMVNAVRAEPVPRITQYLTLPHSVLTMAHLVYV